MRRYTSILLILLTALASQQCYYRIDHDQFGTGGVLGVNSLYTPDSVWSFDLFLTKAVLDTAEGERVPDADIRIWADGEPVSVVISRSGNRFFSDYYPQQGVFYRIEIDVPGHPTLSAETSLTTPATMRMTSPGIELDTTEWGWAYIPVSMEVEDPPGQEDFYRFHVEGRGTLIDDRRDSTITDTRWTIRLYFPPTDPNGMTSLSYFTPEDGSTTSYHLVWSGDDYPPIEGNRYRLALRQYGQELITYNRSISDQNANEGNPYTQPTQVYTNVAGGVGIVDGFHRVWIDLE